MAHPLNREAPSSRASAGRGVVTRTSSVIPPLSVRSEAAERTAIEPTQEAAEEQSQAGGIVPILPNAAKGSLLWRVGGVIRQLRPHQWLKNAFVLAPVVFAKDVFRAELLVSAVAAFLIFCLLAGAVYTMNDIVDVESDKVHPVKRLRPLPSGRVPLGVAKALAVSLVAVSLTAAVWLDIRFALIAFAYFILNVAYSFQLKKVAYLDVICIAAGFVLRVVAGGAATHIKVSSYLLACTALLALFLGFGKRRHELSQAAHNAVKQRQALESYSARTLTVALTTTAIATVTTYLLYTLDPQTRAFFHTDWLWLTTGFTVFGMMRFLQLVATRPKAESPTQEMLRDVPFILNLVLWVVCVLVIVYRIRPGVGS